VKRIVLVLQYVALITQLGRNSDPHVKLHARNLVPMISLVDIQSSCRDRGDEAIIPEIPSHEPLYQTSKSSTMGRCVGSESMGRPCCNEEPEEADPPHVTSLDALRANMLKHGL
jgi:hypothetical protein